MKKILLVLVLCLAFFGAVACGKDKKDDSGKEQQTEEKAPVITVTPQQIEMNAGDEIDLLFGVTATDEVDGTVTVIVSNDGNFDADVEGTYTITYKAVNSKGKEATATRTIVVAAALSNLALEVKANNLGETKWPGKTITFKNALYVELTESKELTKQSGVFHNNTTSAITLSVEGGYGCSAVLDANGVVVEGRDGANSKLVNAQNPTRAGSTVTKLDEETTVASAFAKNLVIPAGGYAVVIQANYAGTTADTDGRGFMNYNVINTYGNVVSLYWVDSKTILTPYVNQAPTVTGNTTVYVAIGNTTADVNALVVAGITAKDDNGTFALEDDVTITEITVVNNGGFNVNTAADYTFTLKVTDGEKETQFTRTVSVLPAENCVTLTIGEKSHIVLNSSVAIDQDLTGVGTYSYIIYTPSYQLPEGQEDLGYTNGYGEAFLLNQYGEIVVIFDGANGRKFTLEHHTLTPTVDTESCTPASYIADAFAEAQEKGLYLVIAPNATANNGEGGSRKFLLDNRKWGEVMTITGIEFALKQIVFSVNGKSFAALPEQVVINEVVNNMNTYKMGIYRNCEAETITCNGYGVAVVLDKFGKLVRIYDGANGKLFNAENPSGLAGAGFDGNTYATYAYSQLAKNETLIIFPNDGTNGPDSPRTFGLGLRMDGSIGQVTTLTSFEFAEEKLEFAVNGKTFTAPAGKFLVNTVTDKAATYKMLVYKNCEAETITCNGYGVAVVLDKYGKINRIYDGANGKLFDAENSSGLSGAGFTGGDYATYAYTNLADDETLVIFPNDGVNAADSPRTFALGLRMDGSIGKVVTLTDIEFEVEHLESLTLNGNTFTKESVTILVNDPTATNTSADFLVYTSAFVGTIACTNGYGIAFVIKDGKVVRIYDGTSGKYYDAENTSGVTGSKCSANNYLKEAIASLGSGEYVVCAPHDGGANVARGFLNNNKVIGADFVQTYVTVETSTETCNALAVNNNFFFGAKVAMNEVPGTLANYDFVVYSYGYTGRVLKNGWCVAIIVDVATMKTVKVYDGANAKYYDAENPSGVQDATKIAAATALYDAFEALEPGQVLIVGVNGGKNSNAGRAFLNSNRVVDKAVLVYGITLPTPSTTEVNAKALVVDGEKYYVTEPIKENENASATDAFLIIRYGFEGTVPANGYGVAFVVNAEGKVVRIYDGASGKYYDKDNTGGIQDANLCAAGTYLAQAVASLQEGEYVLCAPNGGSANNVARGFLYGHRKVDIAVVLPEFVF